MRILIKKHSCLLLMMLLSILISFSASFCSYADEPTDPGITSTGTWTVKNNHLRYRFANKTYAKSGFYQIENEWYYFDKSGYVTTGWFKVNNSSYYGNTSSKKGTSGQLLCGWQTINKKVYYFSKSTKKGSHGKMLTGWQVLNKRTYYFGSNGVVRTGWQNIKNKKFYFVKSSKLGTKGKMLTGWHTLSGDKYYFTPTGSKGTKGACVKNKWITVDGKEYYMTQTGKLNEFATHDQSSFISMIGKLAQKDMKRSHILASVTTAQAILESGYGTSSLALEANNLFGMKATLSGNTWKSSWGGKTYTKKTMEYLNGKWYTITDTFRAYKSVADSLADHSDYLAGAKNGSSLRYRGVIGNKSYRNTLQLIKNGGYATDPQYVSKLVSIIQRYNLTKYDR